MFLPSRLRDGILNHEQETTVFILTPRAPMAWRTGMSSSHDRGHVDRAEV